MPAICENAISTKLSENLTQNFKKSEKESSKLIPTVNQVLSAEIEYEEVSNHKNSTLDSLQIKYIVLKPNQQFSKENVNFVNSKKTKNINTDANDINVNGSATPSSYSSSSTQLPQPKRVLFSKDKIQISWSHQVTLRNAGTGFNNIGNTCYLNSALQAFFHVPAIAQWLLSDREHRDKNCRENQMCIICAMSSTLQYTQNNNGSFTPSLITNRLQQICKHLTLGRQEDAHEFLRYLVEKMEKSFLWRFRNEHWFKDLDQYSKETTPLNQILGGYLRSTVTCLSCNHDSVTFQHFQDLPLDISRVASLNEAISGYFSRENLEECGYKCESCKKRVSAAKRFSLERAPVVLCIQLKRFTAMGGKMSKHIQISEKLNLQKFLSKWNDSNQNCTYRFVSMVTHLGGSASGGHYTAVGLGPNGNFYNFDDSRVSSITLEAALRGNAYVLFYELVHQQQLNYCEKDTQNGNSIFYKNGHNYIKNGTDGNNSSSNISCSNSVSLSNGNFDKIRGANFSKPILPKLIPSNIIKQQNKEKSPSPANLKQYSKSIPVKTYNNSGHKRELGDDQHSKNEIGIKKIKLDRSQQFNVPRLSNDNKDDNTEKTSILSSIKIGHSNGNASLLISSKPKSLVPAYETDDDDDGDDDAEEDKLITNETRKESQNYCRTSSGVFIETDFKENLTKCPSTQGSTFVVTKASINQKNDLQTNGNIACVVRKDDTIKQLVKLNHNSYGTQNVKTWTNEKINTNNVRDQHDRKRRYYGDDDLEMDRGKVKRVRYQNSILNKEKLPNPFNEHQSILNNQNGRKISYGNNNNNGNRGLFLDSKKRFHNQNGYHRFNKDGHHKYNNRNSFRNNHHMNYNYRR